MKRLLGAATAAMALAIAPHADAANLRMLSSWDNSYTAVPLIADVFVDMVEADSDGDITISMTGPEAVPPFEQIQPMSVGVFDMLFTHGGYHSSEVGLSSAIDAIDGDPDKRRESGVWDYIDNFYQEGHNLKLISIPTAITGYRLYLREPMVDGRLDGLKIRATAGYHKVVEELGGAPVVLPAGEMYAAAERGIVDGIAWPAVGAVDFKLCEVTPHTIAPAFGVVSYLVLMNLDAYNRLTEEEQGILLEAGKKLEHNTVDSFAETLAEEDARSAECGSQIDEQTAEWGETANQFYAERAWNIAGDHSPEKAAAFREFALDKGMTK